MTLFDVGYSQKVFNCLKLSDFMYTWITANCYLSLSVMTF